MGEMLLESGAEISRVEDTIVRMGQAYGAVRTEVFVITSIISLTMEFGDGYVATETRRSVNEVNTDFRRIESINAISRECCADPMPVSRLRHRVYQAAEGSKSKLAIFIGSVLAAVSFAVFFGGAAGDAVIAGTLALGICILQKYLSGTKVRTMESNLLVSLLLGLTAGIFTVILPSLHLDKILIGDIMLLIPGIPMTNSIRNMLVGDTISGIVRLAESLMWAVAIAGGIMVALVVISYIQ
ncbi:MAG: threonine/serine exporter family protein [Mogibacterium sp.]|nr:threonine/serine exporter family protein [Mogibacterium sp.]